MSPTNKSNVTITITEDGCNGATPDPVVSRSEDKPGRSRRKRLPPSERTNFSHDSRLRVGPERNDQILLAEVTLVTLANPWLNNTHSLFSGQSHDPEIECGHVGVCLDWPSLWTNQRATLKGAPLAMFWALVGENFVYKQ
ncbi:hypothetical protein PoB_007288700 [Plakobranchus ocellatus]|uniref:Uncharacterized protein n=1 Tax=Plakobranchus ocellatus TaxID=259542 RepID=A0AAV4DPX6_9GAST|nr:hypothetical protein PoB_007288700 [Plakobranchus ocellatus]